MRIWAFAVQRWQFTLLLFGLLIAVGITTLHNIPRAEDPEFHAPVPIIVVAYPGADPADIERLIVDRLQLQVGEELDDQVAAQQRRAAQHRHQQALRGTEENRLDWAC